MHVNCILSGLLLLSTASAQISTKSLVTCFTKQGPKSTLSVRTTSKVLTIPWYAYRVTTSTPSTTTTPPTSTQVVSTTTTILSTTTLPVETDTLTATLSVISTDSITATTSTTSTAYETVTVSSTGTTTIAASAGFVPAQSNIPGSMKRDALEERQTGGKHHLSVQNGKLVCNPAVYPQSVECVGLVAVITTLVQTKTARSTRTLTAPTPIVTSTTTFTTSSTVTVTPARASTTTTITTTISTATTTTITQSLSTTLSATVTVNAPQATFYAACAANNIISTISGQGIAAGDYGSNVVETDISSPSAYDCCVTCITTPGCGGAAFVNSASACALLTDTTDTCSQNNVVLSLYRGDAYFEYSNGYCGSANLAS